MNCDLFCNKQEKKLVTAITFAYDVEITQIICQTNREKNTSVLCVVNVQYPTPGCDRLHFLSSEFLHLEVKLPFRANLMESCVDLR